MMKRGRPSAGGIARAIPFLALNLLLAAVAARGARLVDPPPRERIIVEDVTSNTDTLRFTFRTLPGFDPDGFREPWIFCVPPGSATDAAVLAFGIDGKDGMIRFGAESLENLQPGIDLRPLGIAREWSLVALLPRADFFAPLTSDDAGAAATLTATIELRFSGGEEADVDAGNKTESPARNDDEWMRVMRALVVNTRDLESWRWQRSPQMPGVSAAVPLPVVERVPRGAHWHRIRVAEPGLCRIDPRDFGIESPESLRLYLRGAAHPILHIDDRGSVYFINERSTSEFSVENVYWAADAPDEAPVRMPDYPGPDTEREPPPEIVPIETIRAEARIETERELVLSTGFFGEILDFRRPLARLSAEQARTFTFTLHDPVIPPDGRHELRLRFFLHGEPDRATPDFIDSIRVTATAPDGSYRHIGFRTSEDLTHGISLPAAWDADGRTTFALALESPLDPGPVRDVWLDDAELTYERLPKPVSGALSVPASLRSGIVEFTPDHGPVPPDVQLAWTTNEAGGPVARLEPSRAPDGRTAYRLRSEAVTGIEFRTLDSARSPASVERVAASDLPRVDYAAAADMLIIAHRDFLPDLPRLVALHDSLGIDSRLIDVQSVYDRFSEGELDPHAIRNFIASFRPAPPPYILLVGDCTSDYRDEMKSGIRNYVPSHTHKARPESWASDEWFTQVRGDDPLPDAMIGRLSVNNRADLDAILTRLEMVARDGTPAEKRATVTLVSDNEETYPRTMDRMAENGLPEGVAARRIYLDELPVEDNWIAGDDLRRRKWETERRWMKLGTEATGRIRRAFADGTTVLAYLGHGSPNIWSDERVWFGGDSENSDNLLLADLPPCPLVLNFSCNTGAIDYPLPKWNVNIIEDMMRVRGGGGAVAAWVSSGPGKTRAQEPLGALAFDTLFGLRLNRPGEFAVATKIRFAALAAFDPVLAGQVIQYLSMYVLLGDPAFPIPIPDRLAEFVPDSREAFGGAAIPVSLDGISPGSGRYVATLESERGEITDRREGEFDLGRAEFSLAAPHAPEELPCTIRLFLTPDAGEGSVAAAGRITVRPDPVWLAANTLQVAIRDDSSGACLRIRPGSVRVRPESPSEGETIFIDVVIENAGRESSLPSRLSLLDGDPAAGGAPVYNHNRQGPDVRTLGGIEPGGVEHVELRWDPVFNSGEQEFWIILEPDDSESGSPCAEERLTSGTVRVRSRPVLAYRNVGATATPGQAARLEMTLRAEIVNSGETDARNVQVAFYRGGAVREENLIHETLIETVPAQSFVTVTHDWAFGSLENLADADGVRGFRIQVWLKGARDRITSGGPGKPEPEEESEEESEE